MADEFSWYKPWTYGNYTPTPETTKQMGTIGTMLSFFGTINSAVGTYYASQAQASALAHQAEMQIINSRIMERAAQSRMLQGEKEIGRLSLKAGKLKSAQKVSLAANGVVLGSGNAAEIIASTDLLKEIDTNQIFQNAVQDSWAMRARATNAMTSALTNQAAASSISPFGSATGTLLSGAGEVAKQWYALDRDLYARS